MSDKTDNRKFSRLVPLECFCARRELFVDSKVAATQHKSSISRLMLICIMSLSLICSVLVRRFSWFISSSINYPNFLAQRKTLLFSPIFESDVTRNHLKLRRELATVSKCNRTVGYIMMVLALTYCIRSLTFIAISPTFSNSELSLQCEQNETDCFVNSRLTYKYNCLLANCSSSSSSSSSYVTSAAAEEQLLNQLNSLPVHQICQPLISRFFSDPIQQTGFLGLFISINYVWFCFMNAIVLQLMYLVFPTGNPILAHVLAPKLTRVSIFQRAKTILNEVQFSYRNFCAKYSAKIFGKQFSDFVRRGDQFECNCNNFCEQDFNRQTNIFAGLCWPLNRTKWWRKQVSMLFVFLTFQFFLSYILNVGSASIFACYYLNAQQEDLVDIVSTSWRKLNCTVRYEDPQRQLEKPFDLSKIVGSVQSCSLQGSFYYFFVAHTLQGCTVFVYLSSYFVAQFDLMVHMFELKFQLLIGLELVGQVRACSSRCGSFASRNELQEMSSIPKQQEPSRTNRLVCELNRDLRRIFESATRLDKVMFLEDFMRRKEEEDTCTSQTTTTTRASSRLESTLAIQDYVNKLIKRENIQTCDEFHIKFLEKVYVDFRIFVDHINAYGATIVSGVIYVAILVYGAILANIVYIRTVNMFSIFALCLCLLSWILATLMIYTATNFHNKVGWPVSLN